MHVGKVTVFFRGASWHIYYREEGIVRRIRVGPDREEAERRAAEVNAQLAHGVPSAYGYERVTVEELVGLWLEHHELVLRSSVATVQRYRTATGHLLRFVREKRPALKADAFGPCTAEEFVKHLRRTPVSPRALQENLSSLHSVFTGRLLSHGIIRTGTTVYATETARFNPFREKSGLGASSGGLRAQREAAERNAPRRVGSPSQGSRPGASRRSPRRSRNPRRRRPPGEAPS